MVFDFEKFLVERKETRRRARLGDQLALRVLENFILMGRHLGGS